MKIGFDNDLVKMVVGRRRITEPSYYIRSRAPKRLGRVSLTRENDFAININITQQKIRQLQTFSPVLSIAVLI